MSVVTDKDIAQVLAALSLNYNRPLDDEVTVAGMVEMWRASIGGCAAEDVVDGLQRILRDQTVDRFPTVAQFRAHVIAANRARHATLREAAGGPPVSCSTCLDSGWVDLGNADDGSWWVKACPSGCRPPLSHHRQRPPTVRTNRTGPAKTVQQLELSRATLEEAIAGQHRVTGERSDPLRPF